MAKEGTKRKTFAFAEEVLAEATAIEQQQQQQRRDAYNDKARKLDDALKVDFPELEFIIGDVPNEQGICIAVGKHAAANLQVSLDTSNPSRPVYRISLMIDDKTLNVVLARPTYEANLRKALAEAYLKTKNEQ